MRNKINISNIQCNILENFLTSAFPNQERNPQLSIYPHQFSMIMSRGIFWPSPKACLNPQIHIEIQGFSNFQFQVSSKVIYWKVKTLVLNDNKNISTKW